MTSSYIYSKIQAKYASREIAASVEFQEKWAERPVIIAITDFWDVSGKPQHALADTLQLVAASPSVPECIAVLEASPEAIECARKFLETCDDTLVAYDCTNTFDALYPPDSFELTDASIGTDLVAVRYVGDTSHIPAYVIEGVEKVALMSAEQRLLDISSLSNDFFGLSGSIFRQRISTDTKKLDLDSARKYISILSCGELTAPKRSDFGLDEDDDTKETDGMSLLEFSRYANALPIKESIMKYSSEIEDVVSRFSNVKEIWKDALKCTPFKMISDSDNIAHMVEEADPIAIRQIAEVLGVSSMLDAYLSGVPIEDVLA